MKKRKGREPTLLFEPIKGYPKVQSFLDDAEAPKTRKIYQIGLAHFETFLSKSNHCQEYNTETIIQYLKIPGNEQLRYTILNEFKNYFRSLGLASGTISIYIAPVRSYFEKYNVEISQRKYKQQVKPVKIRKQHDEPIDKEDVRNILLKCTNPRLKAFILVLATSGLRALEAIKLINTDIDFSVSPTRIHIRKENSKTGIARDVYITEEATECLKEWIQFKYRQRARNRTTPIKKDTDMVFAVIGNKNPEGVYLQLIKEFKRVLKLVKLDDKKEGVRNRNRVTFHSFRSFVKTTISDLGFYDYSVAFLGHATTSDSVYYKKKEPARRQFYKEKIEPHLKFLNITKILVAEKDTQAKITALETESSRQIELLKKEMLEMRKRLYSSQLTEKYLLAQATDEKFPSYMDLGKVPKALRKYRSRDEVPQELLPQWNEWMKKVREKKMEIEEYVESHQREIYGDEFLEEQEALAEELNKQK